MRCRHFCSNKLQSWAYPSGPAASLLQEPFEGQRTKFVLYGHLFIQGLLVMAIAQGPLTELLGRPIR